jgi:hypothetical protein
MATTADDTTSDPLTDYADASTQRVTAENGIEYAYRDLGSGDVPLVVLQHFRRNLDNWDPALVDALAAERRVVAFDNVGVGATAGTTPNTVETMAHDAIAFVEAMRFDREPLGLPSHLGPRRGSRAGGRHRPAGVRPLRWSPGTDCPGCLGSVPGPLDR